MNKFVSTVAMASVLAVGSASVALAGQPAGASDHGSAVAEVAKAADSVAGKTHGEDVSTIAKEHGATISALAKVQGAAASAAGKAKGSAAADAHQATGATASEPGRLKAIAGQEHRP